MLLYLSILWEKEFRLSDGGINLQTWKWSGSKGHLNRAAGEGWWKKADFVQKINFDFVQKINFNFVEPHNPFLLDGVGRTLDA